MGFAIESFRLAKVMPVSMVGRLAIRPKVAMLVLSFCVVCVGIPPSSPWQPADRHPAPLGGVLAHSTRQRLSLRGGFVSGLEHTDVTTQDLERRLGGRDKAKKSLVNNGFGKLLDDLDDIANTITSTGLYVCRHALSVSTVRLFCCPQACASESLMSWGLCSQIYAHCTGPDGLSRSRRAPLTAEEPTRKQRLDDAGTARVCMGCLALLFLFHSF